MIQGTVKPAETGAGSEFDFDALTPRIIQFKGRRSCIRLEDIYWDVLEDEARTRECKFNELVHQYYHDPKGEKNKTAYLRRQAVDWLSKKVKRANELLHLQSSELRAVLRATVQPAIVFSEQQSVSRYNQAFRDWLDDNTHTMSPHPDYAKLRISFRRSYEVLMDLLETGRGSAISEQVTVLLPGYVFPIRMNIVKIHKKPGQDRLFLGIVCEG